MPHPLAATRVRRHHALPTEFRSRSHLEMQHLQAAERLRPFIDVSLFVSKARLRAYDVGGAHKMSAIARVAYDKHLASASKYVVAALEAQNDFWSSLAEPVPRVQELMDASVAMNAAIASADDAFEHLHRIKAKVGGDGGMHWWHGGVVHGGLRASG